MLSIQQITCAVEGRGILKGGNIKSSSKADCLSMDEGNEWFITQPCKVVLTAGCELTPFITLILKLGSGIKNGSALFPYWDIYYWTFFFSFSCLDVPHLQRINGPKIWNVWVQSVQIELTPFCDRNDKFMRNVWRDTDEGLVGTERESLPSSEKRWNYRGR